MNFESKFDVTKLTVSTSVLLCSQLCNPELMSAKTVALVTSKGVSTVDHIGWILSKDRKEGLKKVRYVNCIDSFLSFVSHQMRTLALHIFFQVVFVGGELKIRSGSYLFCWLGGCLNDLRLKPTQSLIGCAAKLGNKYNTLPQLIQ